MWFHLLVVAVFDTPAPAPLLNADEGSPTCQQQVFWQAVSVCATASDLGPACPGAAAQGIPPHNVWPVPVHMYDGRGPVLVRHNRLQVFGTSLLVVNARSRMHAALGRYITRARVNE